jgi:hypothetical protein
MHQRVAARGLEGCLRRACCCSAQGHTYVATDPAAWCSLGQRYVVLLYEGTLPRLFCFDLGCFFPGFRLLPLLLPLALPLLFVGFSPAADGAFARLLLLLGLQCCAGLLTSSCWLEMPCKRPAVLPGPRLLLLLGCVLPAICSPNFMCMSQASVALRIDQRQRSPPAAERSSDTNRFRNSTSESATCLWLTSANSFQYTGRATAYRVYAATSTNPQMRARASPRTGFFACSSLEMRGVFLDIVRRRLRGC